MKLIGTSLTTLPVGQHVAELVCVPLGQAVVLSRFAAVVRTTPTALSFIDPSLRSATKKVLRTGSAATTGVPKGEKVSTLVAIAGSPPSESAAQLSLDL